jgi:hypothetical protein
MVKQLEMKSAIMSEDTLATSFCWDMIVKPCEEGSWRGRIAELSLLG